MVLSNFVFLDISLKQVASLHLNKVESALSVASAARFHFSWSYVVLNSCSPFLFFEIGICGISVKKRRRCI